jgi:hypothetical protein
MGEPADSETPPPKAASSDGSVRRWVVSLSSVALLVAASAMAVVLFRDDDDPALDPLQRADAVTDLLAWIPATDETRRAFAVWSEDAAGADGTPAVNAGIDPLVDRLGLTPLPFTLGRSSKWRDRFGYGARDVKQWATAGSDSSIAVLVGDFDTVTIEAKLRETGFRTSRYHGVTVYVLRDVATPSATVDGDAVSAANVVALFAGRLITSASVAAVHGAIDAAQGRVPSLADEPGVAKVLRAMAPISGLVAVDAADHAIDCGVGGGWTHNDLARRSGRYVVVGYGRLGGGGDRRTLVVTSLADAAAADAALDKYAAGWEGGAVDTAGAGADISVFGRVSSVGQTDNLLIAELVEGREDGWVRAGIRYANPVCQVVATALPSGTPESSTGART